MLLITLELCGYISTVSFNQKRIVNALSVLTLYLQTSFVQFYDFSRKTQTNTTTLFLCTKEWNKYLISYVRRNTTTIVGNRNTRLPFFDNSLKQNDIWLFLFTNSISSICYEINQYLFNQVSINFNRHFQMIGFYFK